MAIKPTICQQKIKAITVIVPASTDHLGNTVRRVTTCSSTRYLSCRVSCEFCQTITSSGRLEQIIVAVKVTTHEGFFHPTSSFFITHLQNDAARRLSRGDGRVHPTKTTTDCFEPRPLSLSSPLSLGQVT